MSTGKGSSGASASRKQDAAVAAPDGGAHEALHRSDGLDHAGCQVEPPELAIGEEGDLAVVRRPERTLGSLGSSKGNAFGDRQTAEEEPGRLPLAMSDENDLLAVRRDHRGTGADHKDTVLGRGNRPRGGKDSGPRQGLLRRVHPRQYSNEPGQGHGQHRDEGPRQRRPPEERRPPIRGARMREILGRILQVEAGVAASGRSAAGTLVLSYGPSAQPIRGK